MSLVSHQKMASSKRYHEFRYTEISYLCSIRDVLESWTNECRSSLYQQIYWFPLTELVVITHINSADKMQLVSENSICLKHRQLKAICKARRYSFNVSFDFNRLWCCIWVNKNVVLGEAATQSSDLWASELFFLVRLQDFESGGASKASLYYCNYWSDSGRALKIITWQTLK